MPSEVHSAPLLQQRSAHAVLGCDPVVWLQPNNGHVEMEQLSLGSLKKRKGGWKGMCVKEEEKTHPFLWNRFPPRVRHSQSPDMA